MNKKGKGAGMIILVIIIAIVLWGLVGAYASQDVGVTCDMGVGNILCWKWHTNTIGQVSEAVSNIFG